VKNEFDDRVVLRVDFGLALPEHAQARVDEEGAEDVDDPVEAVNQRGTEPDHDDAHDERAEHAPEEDAVLILGRDLEVTEDEQEDEEVINRERQLDDVTRQEFDARHTAQSPEDAARKQQRQRDPDGAPSCRLAIGNRVRLAVEDAQVERQHDDDENSEPGPSPD
jgi:hypothetical protein